MDGSLAPRAVPALRVLPLVIFLQEQRRGGGGRKGEKGKGPRLENAYRRLL